MRGITTKFYQRLLYIAIVIFFLFMVKSTLAFWTQTLRSNNEYQLGKYSTKIEEEFEAPMNWLPGQHINTEVLIANEGSVPVFVKAQVNLSWHGQDELTGEEYELTFISEPAKIREYAALISWGEEVVLLAKGRTSTESLKLGLPVVNNINEATGKWLLLDEKPDNDGNLIFYYIGTIEAAHKTPLLIDGVQMNPNIIAKITNTHTSYDKEVQEWKTHSQINPSYSYENAKFLLAVNAQTVQAAGDAIRAVFINDRLSEQAVIEHLRITTPSVVTHGKVKGKSLFFEEINGNIQFTPAGSDGKNWFMSFENMVPGGQYVDTLVIENRSQKNYDLHMQVIPRDNQEAIMKELLELIQMKVYLAEELIYEGAASGSEYLDASNNLQNAVSLGKYQSNKQNQLRVELKLSENTSLEYCELLAKTDWKFMANEITSTGQPDKTISPPKTGDNTVRGNYIIAMAIAAMGIIVCVKLLKRQKRTGGKR